MAIFDLYFKRQRRLKGEVPDVYLYDQMPHALRVQIVHVWDDTLGNAAEAGVSGRPDMAYSNLVRAVRRELGQFNLSGHQRYGSFRDEWNGTFLATNELDLALSMVELSVRAIHNLSSRVEFLGRRDAKEIAESGIEEINARFREHDVGYQIANGEVIRVDSQFMHAETVKPALSLLQGAAYEGAQQEFLKAHEHYRHGDTKGSLTEALKALESVMQTICQKRGWEFDTKATSKTLIGILFDKGLIPTYWQSHFTGLRTNLESGVPTARNREGGHGQGATITTVPAHLAGYVLHQTAAAILFLVEAEKAFS